ncbi:membrane protein [Eubacterium aggregans]|uniref:Membrane protein n=1 Tax=Eubacterium aggregans TaxID=81409 RepID=A0A1H4D3B6_9FIRM|nr:YihY/virulence factor BrkB family protein [Eubacterium aggregans]SEA67010.1 membrane protein [Eubacterium aggregans]
MDEFKNILTFVSGQIKENRLLNYAAQLSYTVLLAFIPLIMLVYNLVNWFFADLNDRVLNTLQSLLPSFLMPLIETASHNANGPQTSAWGNLVFGFLILYLSVSAVRSLIITITKVMGVPETRNYLVLWELGFVYLLFFIALFLVFIALYLFTQKIITSAFEYMSLGTLLIRYWRLFSLILIAAYLALTLTLLYMYAPPKRLSFLNALPGSIFVSLGWLCVTLSYDGFIQNYFDIHSLTLILEGPFSFIIVIYCISLVLIFGSVVNLYFEDTGGISHEKKL